MKGIGRSFSPELLSRCLLAALAAGGTTIILLFVGHDARGEAAAALLYLVPIGWSTARWGLVPGMCATLTAILAFDFFCIPPSYSFAVAQPEDWLLLVALLAAAVAVIGSIQSSLARAGEHDAFLAYDLSTALAGLRTQDAVVHALADYLQRVCRAKLVEVSVQSSHSPPLIARAPSDGRTNGEPDRVLWVLSAPDRVGEVRLWGGDRWPASEDDYLFRNLATQAELALDRACMAEAAAHVNILADASRR